MGVIITAGTAEIAMYIHEQPGWPKLHWDPIRVTSLLADIRHQQGRLLGRMESLGFTPQQEAVLTTLTSDVVKTSEIEGERLDSSEVRSSIARRLGMDAIGLPSASPRVEGIVEMMIDATSNYDLPLTADRLHAWHASMFPGGFSGITRIHVGAWRDDSTGPMQVVSGPIGRENVHYQAPAASRLEKEMSAFLDWFENETAGDPVLHAAQAHFWFVTLHPFDDGNGRIARAIADMALARSERTPQRFYSMSAQIRKERKEYYAILERTQRGSLDITLWMEWFLACLGRAIGAAQTTLESVLLKARFWQTHAETPFNDRQRVILHRLLDGFEGKLTTSKYAEITKCSQDTALRDLTELIEKGILRRSEAGGRSTAYELTP